MTSTEDPSDIVFGKRKQTETEQSKAGKTQFTISEDSVSSTVSKAKKKLKMVVKNVKKVTASALKGKESVGSPGQSFSHLVLKQLTKVNVGLALMSLDFRGNGNTQNSERA